MAGALDGIRIIDFGQYIAGPFVGMLLADQGADVVRVDPPEGPRWDTPANAMWNRGKRSIVLDLKQPHDRGIARALVQSADVVVENFRPGVMDRLGLGPEAMTLANPRLIYCSMPGFAPDDPRAGVAAWEGIVGAASTTYRPSRLSGQPGRPIYTAVPIASIYAAFQAAVSIVMALCVRERDGVGQRIEVPLFDGMFASLGNRVLRVHNHPERPVVLGWTRQFQCKDGRWIQFHSYNKNFSDFIRAAGIASWEEEGLTDDELLAKDPQLAEEARRRIEELFTARTAQEWEDFVSAVGCETAVCRTTAEWMAHPHARESEAVVEVNDPRFGTMLQPGIGARMSVTPGAVRSPAPPLDAHRDEILAELKSRQPVLPGGTVDTTIRPALDGVKVLDLTIVLAGPTCGRTLAEFGADVIKIDSPNRGGISFHNEINRAKRSILLDLKTEEGLEIFWRLLETADIVVQNYRKGVVEGLGVGYEQVRQRKPNIIYASLNAYGHSGPWANRPGHEQLAQAATGMQERFGDGLAVLQPNAVNDYGTGFLGAYAVALALFHQRRAGQGQHVDTALTFTALALQSPFALQYDGKIWDEPRGQNALGSGPLHRAYQASDGWLFLGARRSDLPRLAGVAGLADVAGLSDDALERALEERMITAPVDGWVERLVAVGIGAHRNVNNARELMDHTWVKEHGLSLTRDHDELGPITAAGPTPRLSRTPVRPGRPAPKPGSDAYEILEEIGLGGELSRLVEAEVVRLEGVAAR